MPLDWSALENEVAETEGVEESGAVLIEKLAAEIEANKDAPARIQAIADRLRSGKERIAAAIAANSGTETPPETPPTT